MADAEIVAVGSELLTPGKIDTNSLFLTDHLNALGIAVVRKSIVGDERELLASTVRNALSRARIILLTGGLGPTEDDVTRDAVAIALDRPLVFRQDLLDEIENKFRKFGRKMTENNRRQAYLVEGAEVLENPRGTAVGQWIDFMDRMILLLPGPPRELNPMFTGLCVPRFAARLPAQVLRTRFYRVTGMGESELDAVIAPVYTRYQNPATTILAGGGDLQIHLRARCASAEEAEGLLAEVGDPILRLLGNRVYSTDGDALETVIGKRLREAKATLAVAESCTGGLVPVADFVLGGGGGGTFDPVLALACPRWAPIVTPLFCVGVAFLNAGALLMATPPDGWSARPAYRAADTPRASPRGEPARIRRRRMTDIRVRFGTASRDPGGGSAATQGTCLTGAWTRRPTSRSLPRRRRGGPA
jgi:competence/damage-inducible protein CinA-like protein